MAKTELHGQVIKAGTIVNSALADDAVDSDELAAGAVDIAHLSATGTAGSSNFLRGDNSWVTPTDTNTTYTGGTNLTLSGTTFNVDDAFLKNDVDDTTTGTITAGGFTTTGTWTFDDATSGTVGVTTVHTGSSFTDNDTSLMTAGAIKEKIEDYGYTTAVGDITAVTAGTGLSGGGTNGGVTLNVSGLTISELAGDTLQLSSENFADNDTTLMTSAAIQDQIDLAVTGMDVKDSVKVATTAALAACTYSNGSSGVGATLTKNSNGAFEAVDGVTLASVDDRILVKNQGTAAHNGVYKLTTVGTGSTPWVLTRTTDFDASAELLSAPFFFVEAGTNNGAHGFVCSNAAAVTFGTTAITFYQFSAPGGDAVAGSGLTMAGNVLSVDAVNMASGVTGTLAVGNGGTGSASAAMVGIITAADASAAQGAMGASTLGKLLFGLADNSGSLKFPRFNADNTITMRTAANVKSDLAIASDDVSGLVATATSTSAANLTGLVADARLSSNLQDIANFTSSTSEALGTSDTVLVSQGAIKNAVEKRHGRVNQSTLLIIATGIGGNTVVTGDTCIINLGDLANDYAGIADNVAGDNYVRNAHRCYLDGLRLVYDPAGGNVVDIISLYLDGSDTKLKLNFAAVTGQTLYVEGAIL